MVMNNKLAFLILTLILFIFSLNCYAKLNPLPRGEKFFCLNNDPHKIIIYPLGDNDTALFSTNSGKSWKRVKKTDVSGKLFPLPGTGNIRYVYTQNKDTLLISKDSGKTWIGIYPWQYLRDERRNEVEAYQKRYIKKYRYLIPEINFKEEIPVYIISSLLIMAVSLFFNKKSQKDIIFAILASCFIYATVWSLLFFFVCNVIGHLNGEQWQYTYNLDIVIPRWNLSVLLHIAINPYLAPVLSLIVFPVTPLFGEVCEKLPNKKLGKYILYSGIAIPYSFVLFVIFTFSNYIYEAGYA